MRVTSAGPSLASKDHSHEQSVIPSILKRGYYRPKVNVGTLHARVISAGPSLASKDHSHEQSIMQLWLSQRNTVVSNSMSNSPDISFLKPYRFPTSGEAAMYFASAVLRATLGCFLLNNEIMADPKQ